MPKQYLILSEAAEALKKLGKAFPEHKAELHALQERIRAVEHVLTTWVQSDPQISARFLTGEKPKVPLEQKKLLDEYKTAYEKSAKFSEIAIDALWNDLQKLKVKLGKHPFFLEAEECIKSVQESAQRAAEKADRLKPDAPPSEFKAFLSGKPITQQLAGLFGGKYIPFSQGDDPLRGKIKKNGEVMDFRGACYGHVMQWAREKSQKGSYSLLPRFDKFTNYHQKNQTTPDAGRPFNNLVELEAWMSKSLKALKNGRIYRMSIKNSENAHAMGIAFHASGEVEFLDSNHIVAVFPNRELFQKWFLSFFYFNYPSYLEGTGEIAFTGIDRLAKEAQPSIPLDTIYVQDLAQVIRNFFSIAEKKGSVEIIRQSIKIALFSLESANNENDRIAIRLEVLKFEKNMLGKERDLEDWKDDNEEVAQLHLKILQHNLIKEIKLMVVYSDRVNRSSSEILPAIKEALESRESADKILERVKIACNKHKAEMAVDDGLMKLAKLNYKNTASLETASVNLKKAKPSLEKWIKYLEVKKSRTQGRDRDRVIYDLSLAYLSLAKPKKEKAFTLLSQIKSLDNFTPEEKEKINYILKHRHQEKSTKYKSFWSLSKVKKAENDKKFDARVSISFSVGMSRLRK